MNQRLRAVIADDEPLLLDQLERQLHRIWPELEIAGKARNGREALALLHEHDADVAFLDIRMPGLSGLDVAATVEKPIALVFVTAYDEYAVTAFQRAAVDYLLKPVSDERLSDTVVRLKERLSSQSPRPAAAEVLAQVLEHLGQPLQRHLQWLRVGVGDSVELLHTDEVAYFRADLKYTSVFTQTRELLLRKPLAELEAELDAQHFWRIHRSLIVNIRDIKEARRDLRGRYVLTLRHRSEKLRVSQRYSSLFKQM